MLLIIFDYSFYYKMTFITSIFYFLSPITFRVKSIFPMIFYVESSIRVKRIDALEAATDGLRGLEEQRMKIEVGLEPLREQIGELRLKEQAAALNVEQMGAQLREAQADEAALAAALPGVRAGASLRSPP